MKKIAYCLVVLLFSSLLMAQTSSGTWDSETATYTNAKHNITWNLIDELTWIGRPILTESTLFKVRNDDFHILIKLGVLQHHGGPEADSWNYLSQYDSKELQDLTKAEAKRNGMTFKGITAAKSQLCGIHAIKTKSDMTKYYPEHDATVHCIEYTYHLFKNKNIYTVSVTALSVLEEELDNFDRIATMLFNGFNIK